MNIPEASSSRTNSGKETQTKAIFSLEEIAEFIRKNLNKPVDAIDLSVASQRVVLDVYSGFLDSTQMSWRHPDDFADCIYRQATQKIMVEFLKYLLQEESGLDIYITDLTHPTPERTKWILNALVRKFDDYKDKFSFWKFWTQQRNDRKKRSTTDKYRDGEMKKIKIELKELKQTVESQNLEMVKQNTEMVKQNRQMAEQNSEMVKRNLELKSMREKNREMEQAINGLIRITNKQNDELEANHEKFEEKRRDDEERISRCLKVTNSLVLLIHQLIGSQPSYNAAEQQDYQQHNQQQSPTVLWRRPPQSSEQMETLRQFLSSLSSMMSEHTTQQHYPGF